MGKNKKISSIYYIAAVLFYVAAIIAFLDKSKGDTTYGIIWMSLGSAMLCLGSVYVNKKDNNDVLFKDIPIEKKEELKRLKAEDKSVMAIKIVRELTGASLLEAKQYVDKL